MIRKNFGITLISLIITVIILLILAGITISKLSSSGIFEKTKEARDKYRNAQNEEEMQIAKYSNEIENYVNGDRGSYKEELLWEGTATDDGEIALSKPLNNYKYIEVYFTNNDAGPSLASAQKFDVTKLIEIGKFHIENSARYWGYISTYTYNSSTNKFTNTDDTYYGHNEGTAFLLVPYKILGIN